MNNYGRKWPVTDLRGRGACKCPKVCLFYCFCLVCYEGFGADNIISIATLGFDIWFSSRLLGQYFLPVS